jgi:hypothetical protein
VIRAPFFNTAIAASLWHVLTMRDPMVNRTASVCHR